MSHLFVPKRLSLRNRFPDGDLSPLPALIMVASIARWSQLSAIVISFWSANR